MTLTIVLFGYIARITRAGDDPRRSTPTTRADRVPERAPSNVVVRRHVLRNALLPTIAVVAVQVGYLFGGLVAVEFLFNYAGDRRADPRVRPPKDLPLLTSGSSSSARCTSS